MRINFIFLAIALGVSVGLWSLYELPKAPESSGLIRPLTELERHRLFLLFEVGDYRSFRLLDKIISCESNWINSKIGSMGERGYFQIWPVAHLNASKRLGLDITAPMDNLKYGIWLFKKEGAKPWLWSRSCWF